MKKMLLVLGCLAFACTPVVFGGPSYYLDSASFNAVSDISIIEDFETVVPKDTALSSFTSQGITYAGVNGRNVWVASAGYTNFGVDVTTSSVLTATGEEDFTLTIQLDTPVTALGFDTYLNSYTSQATVRVFGAAGELDTYILQHDPTQIGFLGITSSDPISMIQWTTEYGRIENTGIDNVLVGQVVPAPGAFMLGGIGVSIVGWLRKRRAL